MRKFRKSKAIKVISLFVAINFITQIFYPTVALALTSGPNSPEFSTFTPVATTNMVNLSTGDFNYNLPVLQIPGGEGGGYALSLSYDSNISVEQEASWVGFGWTLNPGSINRSLRGIPDDYNAELIKTYNKARPNWTTSKTFNTGLEVISVSGSFNKSLRYNNINGYMSSTGFGIGVKGFSANLNIDGNGMRFSGAIDIKKMLSKSKFDKKKAQDKKKKLKELDWSKFKMKKPEVNVKSPAVISTNHVISQLSPGNNNSPTNFTDYYGYGFTRNYSLQLNPFSAPIGIEVGMTSNFNVQANKFYTENSSFGFFHLSQTNLTSDERMDYFVEKGGSFNRRDKFIGIPFSTPDYFNVAGEGLSGSFRAFHKEIGHLTPTAPAIKSNTEFNMKLGSLGVEVMAGLNFGVGMNIAFGRKRTNVYNEWDEESVEKFSIDDYLIYRFKNDKGGSISYDDDNLRKAALSYNVNFPMLKSVNLTEPDPFNINSANNKSSSYIQNNPKNSGKRFEDISDIIIHNYTGDMEIPDDAILDFSIYNDNGINYVYGQPVFSRNKSNITIDINEEDAGTDVYDNYLAFSEFPLCKETDGEYKINDDALEFDNGKRYYTIQGEISNTPYANDYLLTSIRGNTYIDVDDDGPSDNDFGSWTKFTYRDKDFATSGNADYWYRYRTPYKGLLYSKNSLSDKNDDMGFVITGEKEVYYLETIETNTHIAIFVTNTYNNDISGYTYSDGTLLAGTETRLDGLSAEQLSGNDDPAAKNTTTNTANTKKLEYLEKIVLFSKEDPTNPLQIINFDYDYSLIKNTPNNSNSVFDYSELTTAPQNSGRLTLKKMWVEYQGVVSAKISPYEFEYEYKPKTEVTNAYNKSWFEEYSDNFSPQAQKPDYSPNLLNPWGGFMRYGKSRDNKDIPYIYQGEDVNFTKGLLLLPDSWRNTANESLSNDPAAWTLKQIKLPTGGEIHIQYESDDYNYVQNREVMAMASLIAYNNLDGGEPVEQPVYNINLDDLGVPKDVIDESRNQGSATEELAQYLCSMREFFSLTCSGKNGPEEFVDKNKIYFKYLFDLYGNSPSLNGNTSEYITGYANVIDIQYENVNINGTDLPSFKITLGNENTGVGARAETPEDAAYDFYVNQRQGKLGESNFNHDPGRNAIIKAYEYAILDEMGNLDPVNSTIDNGRLRDCGKELLNVMPSPFTSNNDHKPPYCTNICPELSYLKLPMYGSKRGGGVRVKRLLMYDNGIGISGEEVVFGTEYHYVLEDGTTSSGVATNEPVKEESALVTYLKRGRQHWANRLIAGEDKKQFEGPIGESLLPNPSVTYSRVITSNIHKGKAGSGFTVNEYYTAKDYPYDYVYSKNGNQKGAEATNLDFKSDYIYLPLGIINYKMEKLWMSQGFIFLRNNMNGLFKSETNYAGTYIQGQPINSAIVSMKRTNYYEPGEKIKVYSYNGTEKIYIEETILPGQEMDISMEKKSLRDFSLDVTIEIDISFGWPPPSIWPVIGLPPTISIERASSKLYAVTKVIDYPAIQKSTETYLDGVYTKTEVHAFDKYSGRPVLTSVADDYNGLELAGINGINNKKLFTFSIPASWMYEEMGQKAMETDPENHPHMNSLNTNVGEIKFYADYDPENEPDIYALLDEFSPNSSAQPNHVLSASVMTFINNWGAGMTDAKITSRYDNISNNLDALNRIWRLEDMYIYNAPNFENTTQLTGGTNKRTYNSGWYILTDNMFDWTLGASNHENWINTTSVTMYSPNGNPLEEINALDIPSAVIYGSQYGNHLPVMIAQNADYHSIYFNDYEVKDGGTVPADINAHSGKKVKPIDGTNLLLDNMIIGTQDYIIKFWSTQHNKNSLHINGIYTPTKIARVGEWSLYELELNFDGSSLTLSDDDAGNYIDDLRIQPKESQATCYVYDVNTYKLLTQFDDQHFGLYYQYNAEGKLVRKIIETERGKKTIQETQYNTITKKRDE